MKYIPFIFTLPHVVITWTLGLLLCAVFIAKRPRWEEGVMFVDYREWVSKRWRFSNALPGLVLLRRQRSKEHELVHVRQYQDVILFGFLAGVAACLGGCSVTVAFLIWLLSPSAFLLNMLNSGFRHGFRYAYRGSEHERAAYSWVETLGTIRRDRH